MLMLDPLHLLVVLPFDNHPTIPMDDLFVKACVHLMSVVFHFQLLVVVPFE